MNLRIHIGFKRKVAIQFKARQLSVLDIFIRGHVSKKSDSWTIHKGSESLCAVYMSHEFPKGHSQA